MKLIHRPIAHLDDRGIIRDIFERGAPDSVTHLTFHDRHSRGYHVHFESTQYLYVVSGTLRTLHAPAIRIAPENDWKFYARLSGDVQRVTMETGDLIEHPPGEAHAYIAYGPVVALAFAQGVRQGSDYEKDTYKVLSGNAPWTGG